MKKENRTINIFANIIFILMSLSFLIPFIYVITASLTNEIDLEKFGYTLFPKTVDFSAYKYVFSNPKQLISSYKTTIIISIVGTFLGVVVMTMLAYPLSRREFAFKKQLTFLVFFTMLFGGGLIPSYILNTQYLHLGNTIWIYILPSLASAWHIIIIRTFFQGIPVALIESAKIDGAKEFKIFFKIIIPLSKPVVATVSLLTLLTKWNDWYTSLIYIRDANLFTLQYLLQKILNEAEFLNSITMQIPLGMDIQSQAPTESIKFAMAIIAAGPMIIIFPFFQKYFTGGLTIGAVKG